MPNKTSSRARSETSGALNTRAHTTASAQGTASWPKPNAASKAMSCPLADSGQARGKVARDDSTAPTSTGYLYKTGAGNLTLNPGAGAFSLGALTANGGNLELKSGTFATTGADPFNAAYSVGAGARGGTLIIDEIGRAHV